MESYLKELFNGEEVRQLGGGSSGCISEGSAFQVGSKKIFVKLNDRDGADVMFEGEYESLLALQNTNTVRVPEPMKVCENRDNKGCIFIMEYLSMKPLSNYQSHLGRDLAKLHLHNINLIETMKKQGFVTHKNSAIEEFGFHTPTCCGFIPLDNTWSESWVEFYSRRRLSNKIDLIMGDHGDRELMEIWSELQLKLDKLFTGVSIYPSLLHGDLWGGNAAQVSDGPVIYDAASFYGHHEFDLSITNMFGGFDKSFFQSYHSIIPRAHGFEERHQLYMLFHYLNHWNHFGSGYRGSSLSTMRSALMAARRK